MKEKDLLKLYVTRGKKIAWTQIADRIVLVNIKDKRCYHLAGVGRLIWLWIDGRCTVEELCKKLTKRYGISFKRASRDTKAFVKKMSMMKLITLRKSPVIYPK
jgi:hypothetical protein